MRVDGVVARASIDDALTQWRGLAPGVMTPFQLPEWGWTWWQHFGIGERRLEVWRWEGPFATALVPLFVDVDGSVRVVGDTWNDVGGAITGDAAARAAALRDVLAAALGDRRFVGRSLPLDDARALRALVGPGRRRAVLAVEASPVVGIGPVPGDEYEAARARRASFRELDRLVEDGAEFRCSTGGAGLQADVDTLVQLHRRRFGAQSQLFTPPKEAFLRRALDELSARQAVRLRTMWWRDRPVGAHLELRWCGAGWFFQSGWDPDHARLGPGRMLLAHAIREAHRDGLATYRLLRGDEPYKYRWATSDEPVATVELRAC